VCVCVSTEKVKILVLLAARFIDQQLTVFRHNQHRLQRCTRRRVLNDRSMKKAKRKNRKKTKKMNRKKKKTKRRRRERRGRRQGEEKEGEEKEKEV